MIAAARHLPPTTFCGPVVMDSKVEKGVLSVQNINIFWRRTRREDSATKHVLLANKFNFCQFDKYLSLFYNSDQREGPDTHDRESHHYYSVPDLKIGKKYFSKFKSNIIQHNTIHN